jgi:hypothetical protein
MSRQLRERPEAKDRQFGGRRIAPRQDTTICETRRMDSSAFRFRDRGVLSCGSLASPTRRTEIR